MPRIKKFRLTCAQVPEVFSLPKDLFLSQDSDLIPQESFEQNAEQRKKVGKVIADLELDLNRTCYVDFDGNKASQLKACWLSRDLGGTYLTKGAFPDYAQGANTSACIGELIHTTQFVLPKVNEISETLQQTKRICFVYRNANGKEAGFSFVAAPCGYDNAGNHQGFIISTIQNSTANPKEREVTVLGSENYITSKPQSTLDDDPGILQDELKTAINNDKVFDLVKGIFNPDGSLNAQYIDKLGSRIRASVNIDDRDRKEAQFNCLFYLAEQYSDNSNLQDYIAEIKEQMIDEINFFEEGIYEAHLKALINQIALSMQNQAKSVHEMEHILKDISERVAYIEQLAELAYRNIEMANTYKALAKKIKDEAVTIKFDGTKEDEIKIIYLSQFKIPQVQKKIEQFYDTAPEVKNYFEYKKRLSEETEEKIAQQKKPSVAGFVSRNSTAISLSLSLGFSSGVLSVDALVIAGMVLGLAFPPLTVGLIAVATAITVAGVSFGISIRYNEKKRMGEVKKSVNALTEQQKNSLIDAEQSLQQSINLDSFLEHERPEFLSTVKTSKRKPLTPESVAHALWLRDRRHETTSAAKSRFSIWAKQEKLDFGIEKVESVIEQKYIME